MTGVCKISMNGEVLFLRFGMPACRYFFDRIGQEHIAPMSGDSINETGIAYLLYAGYYNHCLVEDKVPAKTLADFFEHVETMVDDPESQKEFLAVGECFQQSKSVSKFLEKAEEAVGEAKKKLNGMISNPSVTGSSDLTPTNTEELP